MAHIAFELVSFAERTAIDMDFPSRGTAEPRSSDEVATIVGAILKVVPGCRWSFARIDRDGELEAPLESDGVVRVSQLESELKRQRTVAKSGPRIAAMLGPLTDVESGVTLIFADERSSYGILTIVRSERSGPFTSSELSMLTLALFATSERLSALRMHEADDASAILREAERQSGGAYPDQPEAAFYVLNREFLIILGWSYEEQRRASFAGLRTRSADRLPALLEQTVRNLTLDWGAGFHEQTSRFARPVPFLVVRTDPMTGPAGLHIGVRIDRFQPANSLTKAASRFRISPREIQVLSLLLDGEHLNEIGTRLHITSSTVQDHIRSMVEKTSSRNRSDLISRVLGWDLTIEAPHANGAATIEKKL